MQFVRFTGLVIFGIVLTTAAPSAAQTAAAAQSSQTQLEIAGEYRGFYWIVETAADGSRRGGWVSKQIPLDRIDRSALQPLPNQGTQPSPQPVTSTQAVATREIEQARPQQALTASRLDPQTRDGFWFNAGMGVGFAGCQGCVGRDAGLSGGLSLGATISEKVLLGVGTSGWYRAYENGVTLSGGITDFRARFYPSLRSGFFITGGLGLGTVRVAEGRLIETDYGVGSMFGIGWDFRLRHNVSLTPFYNGFGVQTSYDQGYVDQFGVGITIH